jgi:predicted NAD-dependent protein-ADP-ribosyltransferase YbiA (DUF1768 family)
MLNDQVLDPWRDLHNKFKSPIKLENQIYPTVSHYIYAGIVCNPSERRMIANTPNTKDMIEKAYTLYMNCLTEIQQKYLIKAIETLVRDDTPFRELLKSTIGKHLQFRDPNPILGGEMNSLGKALMYVRRKYFKEKVSKKKSSPKLGSPKLGSPEAVRRSIDWELLNDILTDEIGGVKKQKRKKGKFQGLEVELSLPKEEPVMEVIEFSNREDGRYYRFGYSSANLYKIDGTYFPDLITYMYSGMYKYLDKEWDIAVTMNPEETFQRLQDEFFNKVVSTRARMGLNAKFKDNVHLRRLLKTYPLDIEYQEEGFLSTYINKYTTEKLVELKERTKDEPYLLVDMSRSLTQHWYWVMKVRLPDVLNNIVYIHEYLGNVRYTPDFPGHVIEKFYTTFSQDVLYNSYPNEFYSMVKRTAEKISFGGKDKTLWDSIQMKRTIYSLWMYISDFLFTIQNDLTDDNEKYLWSIQENPDNVQQASKREVVLAVHHLMYMLKHISTKPLSFSSSTLNKLLRINDVVASTEDDPELAGQVERIFKHTKLSRNVILEVYRYCNALTHTVLSPQTRSRILFFS